MNTKIIESKQMTTFNKKMDIQIVQLEAFTIMGLTYRFTDPTGRGDNGKGLINDFNEEAAYYGINTDVLYAVTTEPSRVVNAYKTGHLENLSFFFTYGVEVKDDYITSTPFIFCLRRIPAGQYARVTVTEEEVGFAYMTFDPSNWGKDNQKPSWALSFQRMQSQFDNVKDEQPKQDFYIMLS